MRTPTLLVAVAVVLIAASVIHADESDEAITAGRDLYLDYQCWQCHGYEAQGGPAPRLANKSYPFEAFIRFVRHPNVMPAYPPGQLSDEDLRRIYDFVSSIPEPPPLDSLPALHD
jgi:mono/diheme cytochrome c family protein